MSPLDQHTRLHLQDNRAILRDPEQRREAARIVLEQGRSYGLLTFGLPDNHLHLLPQCDARAANRLNQRIEASLKQRLNLSVSFVSYPTEPIRDQFHLSNTVRYIICQHRRHNVSLHPFIEATNIPDLLGMRLIGAYTRENLVQALPRLHRSTILGWTDLTDLRPADAPVSALREATLSATALRSLSGRTPAVVDARRAMLELLRPQLKRVDQARYLGIAERTLYDLEKRPFDPALVQAIRLQLGYRQLLAGAAANPNPTLR